MYKRSLVAAGLILGFSAHSIFAEGGSSGTIELNKRMDRFEQAKQSQIGLKSNMNDMIINTRNEFGNKRVRLSMTKNPFSNRKNKKPKPKIKDPKNESTERKKTAVEKMKANKNKDNNNPNDPKENEKTTSTETKSAKRTRIRTMSKSNKRLYQMIFNGRPLQELTPQQRKQVYEMHKQYAKTREGQILLRTIQRGEGGGLLVIVGKGQKKGKLFKQYMAKLTTRTHPAYQFPKNMRCFVHNKNVNRCSTAAGLYQITKSNYDKYVKYLGIQDFSRESQDIMALELIRTGRAIKVPGNYNGRGYIEMMKGNRNPSLIYGTDDWASSKTSRHKPHNVDYTKIAPTVAKEVDRERKTGLKDSNYYQNWIDESEREANS